MRFRGCGFKIKLQTCDNNHEKKPALSHESTKQPGDTGQPGGVFARMVVWLWIQKCIQERQGKLIEPQSRGRRGWVWVWVGVGVGVGRERLTWEVPSAVTSSNPSSLHTKASRTRNKEVFGLE